MTTGAQAAVARRGPRLGGWRRLSAWVLLLGALGVVVAIQGRPPTAGQPFDPTSSAPNGTAALLEVVESLEGHVDIALRPSSTAETAFLPVDALPDDARRATREWVRAGGSLVVADPASPLADVEPAAQPLTAGLVATDRALGQCELPALADVVDTIQLAGEQSLLAGPGARGCVPVGDGWWLVARSEGQGRVVVLGGAGPFTNAHLGRADNAVLAATLLAPTPDARMTVLRLPRPGEGDQTLGDLVPTRVRVALWLLAGAFGLYALATGRRHGRPVNEGLAIAVPGSELVSGISGLLQRTGNGTEAARLLREDLAADLAVRLGLPPDVPASTVADVLTRTLSSERLDPDTVARALTDPLPTTDADLVDLAQCVRSTRLAAGDPARATSADPGGE